MSESTHDVTVETPSGPLRGRSDGSTTRFAGIPFALEPTGERRFAPPEAVADRSEVLDATAFRAVSPQNPSMMDALFGGETEHWSEDCLHLNVWTPDTEPEVPLPVMVWIHGGGFEMGSGSSPLYDGSSFARSGVVCVSLNYRLGSLGFLELGHLDPAYSGSGNVGLLDQVEALRWVRRNIASLGGDPDNVTIFGESAGAMSVSLLMTAPAARGLFQRAISQSGALSSAKSSEQARADTDDFMAMGGFTSVEELRAAPVADLLAAHAKMSAERISDPEAVMARFGSPLAFLPFRPVADGVVLPTDPLGAMAEGAASGVSLLIGTNLEEWKLFAMMAAPSDTREKLLDRLGLLTEDPGGALAAYETDHPEASPAEMEIAFMTDFVFRMPAEAMVAAQVDHSAVWQYRFDWQSPAFDGMLGASHALEIPFVFDLVSDHRLHVLVGPEAPEHLAHSMHEAWVSFARDGKPVYADVDWPERGAADHRVLVLDLDSRVLEDPLSATREFWSRQQQASPNTSAV
ncbi:MAG: carboxylesterase/lipase family protein [Microthrixaceae bacterium]|nr:carboxylesterase/lipase family protein [Microthrixaceae bacterium]